MRIAAALLLLAVAGGSFLLAWGALRNLWADYQDSSSWTYIIYGAPWLVLAIAAIIAAVRLLRRR